MQKTSSSAESPWLSRWAWFTVAATFGLIGIGGLVTSKEAGMSVPDWPTSYGYNMFFLPISQWVGGIFYEHTHRLWASMVGMFTVMLAVWLYGKNSRPLLRWGGVVLALGGLATLASSMPNKYQHAISSLVPGALAFGASYFWPRCEPSAPWLRRLGVLAFVLVAIQGLLGGLRVTQMADALGIFHGTLAQLFLVLLSIIAFSMTRFWRELPERTGIAGIARFRGILFVVAALVLGQLILGATMRHQHAGLAVNDFPLAHGKLWPATDPVSVDSYNRARKDVADPNPITAAQIYVHMAHRLGAVTLLAVAILLVVKTRRELGAANLLSRGVLCWMALILVQATLGAFTVLSNKAADIATAHVVVGAASLVLMSLLTAASFRLALVRDAKAVPAKGSFSTGSRSVDAVTA